MEKFELEFRGYNKEQVNKFLDKYILEYENLLNRLKKSNAELLQTKQKLEHYENLEEIMNRAIFKAENTGDEIKKMARIESETLVNDAKRKANRIINDALLKAENAEHEADRLRRNVNFFKRRLKEIVEGQLEIIDDIDHIEFRSNDRDGI